MDLKLEKENVKKAKVKGEKLGTCYDDYYKAILHDNLGGRNLSEVVSDFNSLRLCHGTVEDLSGINPRHGHAWLEAEDLCIFVSNDGEICQLPASVFHLLGKIKDVKRYTLKEAASWVVKTGQTGPWE